MNTEKSPTQGASSSASPVLGAAIFAALVASLCCVAPLVLVLIGVSGAWIGQLTAFEQYQPIFLSIAGLALFMAWRKIWRAPVCEDDRACATPEGKHAQKTVFVMGVILFVVVLGFPLVAPLLY
jgi:mercuric ion transport protein